MGLHLVFALKELNILNLTRGNYGQRRKQEKRRCGVLGYARDLNKNNPKSLVP